MAFFMEERKKPDPEYYLGSLDELNERLGIVGRMYSYVSERFYMSLIDMEFEGVKPVDPNVLIINHLKREGIDGLVNARTSMSMDAIGYFLIEGIPIRLIRY